MLMGTQLKNGLNTWSSVIEATGPNSLPPLNNAYKVTMYPSYIANGSILDESSDCMDSTFFWNKKDSVKVLYWHIILHVSTTKKRMEWALKLLGDQVQVDLYLSMDHGVPNVFAVIEREVGPNEIVMQYNQWSMILTLRDK